MSLYQFDSRHKVLLIDRKGFVRTMGDYDECEGYPPMIIRIAARNFLPKVAFDLDGKIIQHCEEVLFQFYDHEYGRYIYREVRP